MKGAAAVAALGGLLMSAALAYGFLLGDGWAEVRELGRYPWFVVSIVDIYVGIALFACWVVMRERLVVALLWIAAMVTLGNLAACAYALLALHRARTGRQSLFAPRG